MDEKHLCATCDHRPVDGDTNHEPHPCEHYPVHMDCIGKGNSKLFSNGFATKDDGQGGFAVTSCRYYADDGQAQKADKGKLRLTLVPRKIIFAIAKIREYGCRKYPEGGTENWRKVECERYRDAMMRHMMAYLDDPEARDAESGLPHLWHLACNVAFLIEKEW